MFRQILGIRFYVGDLEGLLARSRGAGLIVVPSAPVLADLTKDPAHREAVEGADFAITDSGLMVWLWALRARERVVRISGLRYLRALVEWAPFQRPGATFWVMSTAPDAEANRTWLNANGFTVAESDCYLAPRYPAGRLTDAELLNRIELARPEFVILCLGGGVQERLGWYLRKNLSYQPTLICTGAAIAFLSGRQASIPVWADRLMLGWLLRTLSAPRAFLPRYWKAAKLVPLLLRRGSRPVPVRSE